MPPRIRGKTATVSSAVASWISGSQEATGIPVVDYTQMEKRLGIDSTSLQGWLANLRVHHYHSDPIVRVPLNRGSHPLDFLTHTLIRIGVNEDEDEDEDVDVDVVQTQGEVAALRKEVAILTKQSGLAIQSLRHQLESLREELVALRRDLGTQSEAREAPPTPDESGLVEELSRKYRLDAESERFVLRYPFLVPVLLEAKQQAIRYFGPDVELRLEVLHDPSDGSEELFALLRTSLNAEEAHKQLRALDQDWWLDAMMACDGKLNLTIEHA